MRQPGAATGAPVPAPPLMGCTPPPPVLASQSVSRLLAPWHVCGTNEPSWHSMGHYGQADACKPMPTAVSWVVASSITASHNPDLLAKRGLERWTAAEIQPAGCPGCRPGTWSTPACTPVTRPAHPATRVAAPCHKQVLVRHCRGSGVGNCTILKAGFHTALCLGSIQCAAHTMQASGHTVHLRLCKREIAAWRALLIAGLPAQLWEREAVISGCAVLLLQMHRL